MAPTTEPYCSSKNLEWFTLSHLRPGRYRSGEHSGQGAPRGACPLPAGFWVWGLGLGLMVGFGFRGKRPTNKGRACYVGQGRDDNLSSGGRGHYHQLREHRHYRLHCRVISNLCISIKISEQLLRRNVTRFRGWLAFTAH